MTTARRTDRGKPGIIEEVAALRAHAAAGEAWVFEAAPRP